MRTIILLLIVLGIPTAYAQDDLLSQSLFGSMTATDKGAVIAAHFGTSNAEGETTVINAFNEQLRQAFPGVRFEQAWTSHIIVGKLRRQGRDICTLDQLLSQLRSEGYTHLLVQPSYIINGTEMDDLRRQLEQARAYFKDIRIGQPLLSSESDYREVAQAIRAAYADPSEANLLVCHGSKGSFNTAYTMLDYVLRDDPQQFAHWYVGTIEGFPTLQHAMRQLRRDHQHRVRIIPCLLVPGEHVRKDIGQAIPAQLRQEGFEPTTVSGTIGQLPAVLSLFVSHARHAESNRDL